MARDDEATREEHETADEERGVTSRQEGDAGPGDDGACAHARRFMRYGLFGR